MSGQLDYMVLKPIRVQWDTDLEDDDIRELGVGQIIPGDVAEKWPNRAINNLIWVDKIAPVPRGSAVNAEEAKPPRGDEARLHASTSGPPASQEAAQPYEPVKLKGGFYELSDGSTVKGKMKALAAQAELAVPEPSDEDE